MGYTLPELEEIRDSLIKRVQQEQFIAQNSNTHRARLIVMKYQDELDNILRQIENHPHREKVSK